jgi:hypothetical protein
MIRRTVTIGGKEYTLTPLTIAEYKKSRDLGTGFKQLLREGKVTEQAADEFLNAMVAIVLASIQRSDPSVTLESLEGAITYHDAFDILVKLASISMPGPATSGVIQ